MDRTPKQIAQATFDAVNDDAVAELILSQASEQLRSQHVTSMALDARMTQACAFQLAAAAAAGGWAAAQRSGVSGATVLAVLAAIAFLIGALVCFRGVRSDYFHLPGLPPVWWSAVADHPDMTLRHAQCWVAGAIQEEIDDNARGDEERAASLNMSLRYAIGGGVLIIGAALAQMIST